jgi:hypothetical protein
MLPSGEVDAKLFAFQDVIVGGDGFQGVIQQTKKGTGGSLPCPAGQPGLSS